VCSPCPKLRIAVIFVKTQTFCPGPFAQQASVLPLDHCDLREHFSCTNLSMLDIVLAAEQSVGHSILHARIHDTVPSVVLSVCTASNNKHNHEQPVSYRTLSINQSIMKLFRVTQLIKTLLCPLKTLPGPPQDVATRLYATCLLLSFGGLTKTGPFAEV